MKKFIKANHRFVFYSAWFVLGLLQSLFTELQDDEAYYWAFAQFLDWGYFDHPPMIALLIKMGGFLFDGELAVRFFPLVANTATIFLTQQLLLKNRPYLFYAIVSGIAVLQVSGFVAVPDIPLLLFTALFFMAYQRILRAPSNANMIWFGLVAALLVYSKYHGILIILFVLLSNLRLLRNQKIYLAGLIALLLFLPHLYWQYQHNWISFRYHLFESNVNPYKFSYTTDYLVGQLLLAGPLIGFLIWPATFIVKTSNLFERSLKFVAVGFFLFFLLSTLKGKVEPNWTAPAIIPVIILSHKFITGRASWMKWINRLVIPTLLIVFAFRVIMVVNIVPANAIVERYHAWDKWPGELDKRTADLPVVFNNSYQRASKYWFYSGQPTYSLNKFDDRRNNYNFWPLEDSMLGKPVYEMDIFNLHRFDDSIRAPLFTVGYRLDSAYHSFSKIQFHANDIFATAKQNIELQFEVHVPQHYKTYLQEHPAVDASIAVAIFQNREKIRTIELPFTLQQLLGNNYNSVVIEPKLEAGEYFLRFGIMSDSQLYTHNSEKVSLQVD